MRPLSVTASIVVLLFLLACKPAASTLKNDVGEPPSETVANCKSVLHEQVIKLDAPLIHEDQMLALRKRIKTTPDFDVQVVLANGNVMLDMKVTTRTQREVPGPPGAEKQYMPYDEVSQARMVAPFTNGANYSLMTPHFGSEASLDCTINVGKER